MRDLGAGKPHRAGELIVKFRDGADAAQRGAVRGGLGAHQVKTVHRGHKGGDLELMRLPAGVAMGVAIQALKNDPAVEYAEPNWIQQHYATSNDTY